MAGLPHLLVSIPEQKLVLCEGDRPTRGFPVSTSKFGVGTTEGSHHTPPGHFVINEKHGGQAPLGTSFKGRVAVGTRAPSSPGDEDSILTRILRLDGADPENRNTYRRYIYLHGTHQEDLIGTPASFGCIRMKNEDIATLFDLVPVGTTVRICD